MLLISFGRVKATIVIYGWSFFQSNDMSSCRRNLRYAQGDQWIKGFVDKACGILGMPYLDVLEADSSNACAISERNGLMYITYDPIFFRQLWQKNPDYVLIVLLHEVGHLYEGWMGHWSRNSKEAELYADRVAGWLSFEMGVNCNSISLFELNGFRQGGAQHPIGTLRKKAFISGWNDAYNYQPAHKTMRIVNKRKKTRNNAELFIGLGLAALVVAAARRA